MAEPSFWPALAERLPHLVEGQFAAYRRLAHAETGPDDGPRDVTAWENARKAALAHLQALIRVYDLVQAHIAVPAAGPAAVDAGLTDLLSDVRRELAAAPEDDWEFEP